MTRVHPRRALAAAAAGALALVAAGPGGGAAAAPDGAAPDDPAPTRPAEPARAHFAIEGRLIQGGYLRGTAPAGATRVTLADREVALAPDGRFFAAFDRDAPETLVLEAVMPDGRTLRRELAVARRQWDIERVNVPKRSGGTSEAWWRKRKPEWEAIVAARAQETGATGWRQDFVWPVKGRISGRFGRQRIYQGEPGSYHSGIDIAPGAGTPFVAPADGVVVLARTGFSLEGSLIIIDHGMGLNSAFLHASRIVVEEGEAVTQGQHIGNVGASGRATGPHLHWSLMWKDWRLDPLLLAGPMD
ncbi:M23 family metallopeptidase [Erythrobacter sp. HL-111]|uniref:M23 family metallopeptidase n=1 Tax=Erythrobacter sp. HL-111 TaxID=1798193 RepID=UPI0006DB2360|nr:M23 family metallopeptidase [Erythrobacter sp. HL-111]KPP85837.1 MAG: Peptidase, M23/M37 family [Erythrobacteraceae bacterium HL-111]SDS78855.1 Murein DD-endopeptidase MepM and murein hydrolase activator NlpD, contain LysM domain [Erythrobacter sp. HL-111]